MIRITITHLFSLMLAIFVITGCSGKSSNSISPVTPQLDEWRDATASQGSIIVDDDRYWNDAILVKGEIWLAHRNSNGAIEYALGPGVDISSDPYQAIDELPNIFVLPSDDFIVKSDKVHVGLRVVNLNQYFKGLRVWPARAQLVYGRGGKLVKAVGNVFPIGELDVSPSISRDMAIASAYRDIGEKVSLESCDLCVYAVDQNLYLAYRVHAGDWIHFIDARDGLVLDREHLVWDSFDGHISGYASQPNPHEPELIYDFSHIEMRVRVNPSEPYPTSYLPKTDIDGLYSFTAPETSLNAELRLYGPWMNLNNLLNYPYNEVSIKRDITDGVPEEWFLDDSNSIRDERTVFYWANHAWDYMKHVDPTGHEMDWRLFGFVQTGALCNAFANSNSINFYRAAGDCINLGYIPDVVVHEWGHVHQYNQYGDALPASLMREGNSDITANTICDHPFIGWGVTGPNTYFRWSDNELKWPLEECNGQAHCLGRIVAGAFWDMREIVGRDYHDYLWHFSKYLLSQSFMEWGADVVIVDDDDDNPLNGSPHFDTIYQCFEINHNIDIPDATDIPTDGFIIDVVPKNPQVRIPKTEPQKKVEFELTIKCLESEPSPISLWAACDLPWGAIFGPMLPPEPQRRGAFTFTMQPDQIVFMDLYQNIPYFAPLGQYRYHVRAGEWVDNINDILIDDASFPFWIVQ